MSEPKAKRTVISIPEARKVLGKLDVEKADQIQRRTLDYLEKFSKVDASQAKEMRNMLMKECGLTAEEATEVVNIVPRSLEELRVFTAGWKKLLPTETLEKMLQILGKAKP